MLTLDHLAVAGQTLDEATEAVETALGVAMRPGGEHDVFFTHNRLLGLADGLYLEAVAINPDAPTPDRARWFDLDRFTGPARLSNWVCRSNSLQDDLKQAPDGTGTPVTLTRGDLRWTMAVPKTGVLPYDNMFPALMQWQTDLLPGRTLPPSGCGLRRLVIVHPEASQMSSALSGLLPDTRLVFETGPAGLVAEFDTPNGVRLLQ